MVRKVLEAILAVILAVLVFWLSFAWTSACRLEREYQKAKVSWSKKMG